MIDITLIGTGALQPLPQRALASAAITINGHILLLDCGEGTQSVAKKADVSLMKIDAILLTHYHGDHTYGLPGLLQSIGMAGRTEPITIFGPAGLSENMKPFMMLCPYLPYELRFMELTDENGETAPMALKKLIPAMPDGFMLSHFKTEHRVPSIGYRFELTRLGKFQPQKAKALGVPVNEWKRLQKGETVMVGENAVTPDQVMGEARKGLTVVYTGDTNACESAVNGAKNADLLIAEATYGENEQEETANEHGHMTFSQAAQLAKDAGAGELWLTHYSPMVDDPEAYRENAVGIFENAVCGQDGMKTTLRFEE
ncbi:MAG: ribonuclease Z [Clostridia bacterium]|nr:ribonuclease Z [Clostridia bacterium]